MAVNKNKKTNEYTVLMEMVKRIKEENSPKENVAGKIPVSDTCYRKIFADICDSKDKMFYYLRLLTESHYIFTIALIEDDEGHKMEGLYAYVISDAGVIEALKDSSFIGLEAAYEQHFYQRKPSEGIIRELLPQAKLYNNTDLGRILNISVMLQQFAKIVKVDFEEFLDVWKNDKLKELVPELAPPAEQEASDEQSANETTNTDDTDDTLAVGSKATKSNKSDSERAIDSNQSDNIQKMDKTGQWGKSVDKYGVEFLIRIHFRKYDFDKIRWLVRSGRIVQEKDLRYIRDNIRKMEERYHLDPKLNRFKTQMAEVKRVAQIKLNDIFQQKKYKRENSS